MAHLVQETHEWRKRCEVAIDLAHDLRVQRLAVLVAVLFVAAGARVILGGLVEHLGVRRHRIRIGERRLVEFGDQWRFRGNRPRLSGQFGVQVAVEAQEIVGRTLASGGTLFRVEVLQITDRVGDGARRSGEKRRVDIELVGILLDLVGVEIARDGDLRKAALRLCRRSVPNGRKQQR